MRALIRADASHFLGTGHVMRQLTLVQGLKAQGARIAFACRTHAGHLIEMIQDRGFTCHALPVLTDGILGADLLTDATDTAQLATDMHADWVFADHYAINATWQAQQPARVLVMDDMFDRPHDCDILLNQNLGTTAAQYADLVPDRTVCLMGPNYALLRPEFNALRADALARRAAKTADHILITMGGSDQPNATGWVLDLLATLPLPSTTHLTIVMGPTAPHLHTIQAQAKTLPCPTTVLAGTSDMAGLMVQADVAIGAAGSTSWERCALGLPTVQVVLAENQRDIGAALHDAGAAFSLNLKDRDTFLAAARTLIFETQTRISMSQNAAAIIDGAGMDRVMDALSEFENRPF